jgi:hypothetical protein
MRLVELQAEYAGRWVAVKDGVVIDVRENPYQLTMSLAERHVQDATIFRVPAVNDPELVGLG